MTIKFNWTFGRDWFSFPLCIEWQSDLMEYVIPTNRLIISILWWHFAWTFFKERRIRR